MLREHDRDLWTADAPLRFLGVEVGTRMTVVRLPDGRLVLHSPIAHDAGLADAVEALGPIGWILAPNRFHHLYVSGWQAAAPEARVLIASGLAEKRPDLADADALAEARPPAWADVLEVASIDGFPFANECVLFHRPSATLIASDLAFHFARDCRPLGTRLFIGLSGRLGELAPTLLERMLIRDRPAFRRSLERVLEWPFERVVVAHGEVLERGGREALARGYDFLLARD